ncbi:MAG: hypothetical protein Kow00124_16130 [Anaerolineae bacterium]
MLEARRVITGRTYSERRENYVSLHKSAIMVDLQAHPSLASTWFGYDLTLPHDRPGLVQRLLHIDPLGLDPLSVRTSFPKLVAGDVDVQVSTIYALERDTIRKDLGVKVRLFGVTLPWTFTLYTVLSWLRWLPYLNTMWRSAVRVEDYYTGALIALDNMERQIARHMEQDPSTPGFRRIEVAHSPAELRALLARHSLAIVHALEGAHCLEGPETRRIQQREPDPHTRSPEGQAIVRREVLANLEAFYSRGVAIMGLCHYYPNEVSESVFSYPEPVLERIPYERWLQTWPDHTRGLTDLGKEVVDWMLTHGMIIDVSHVSPTSRMEIYNMVDTLHHGKKGAVLASHIGVQAMYNHPYNLADWEIEWFADHDCVVGVMLSSYWLAARDDLRLALGLITDTIDHLVRVGGEKVVAFGSDFDGFSNPPDEIQDASRWMELTRHLFAQYAVRRFTDSAGALLRREIVRKYSDDTIRAFLGGNALNTILQGWGRP